MHFIGLWRDGFAGGFPRAPGLTCDAARGRSPLRFDTSPTAGVYLGQGRQVQGLRLRTHPFRLRNQRADYSA